MSLENEDPRSPCDGSDKFDDVLKMPKISYSREFLCSLSNLDICKKLPSGFDESLLCEFEENLQDRPRNPGSLPLQGFRRNEYGSSPPTRGDSFNYSRGIHGKWESRSSSGRSDRDSDSQSDRDSDSGRRYGHQSGRFRPTTEQDGLLGSGSFPRASGYAAGISGPKVRANEPYHPPRPYKAVPYSRKDTDAFNDETFGSLECSDEDRAEEERKRRASFELMRKEQQKVLQEKQTLNVEKHKSSDIFNLCEALEDKKEEKEPFVGINEISDVPPALGNASEKSFLSAYSSASRPVVPPGFKNNVLEKSSGLNPPIHHPLLKEKPVTVESLLDGEVNSVQNGINDGLERQLSQEISLVDGQLVKNSSLLEKRENLNLHTSLDVHIRKPGMEDRLPHASNRLDSRGTLDDPITEHDAYISEDKTVANFNKTFSTSIMGKIFGTTLSMNNEGSGLERYDSKPDDTRSPNSVRSSKFSQWFYDEEAKPADDISRGKPNDLLSLIVGADKVKHQVSNPEAAAEHFPHDLFSNTLEKSKKLTFEFPSTANEACVTNIDEAIPSVLTCTDLEQSILTEYSAKTTDVQPLLKSWSKSDANTEQSKSEHIDNHASLHLLALLQKGTDPSSVTLNSSFNVNSTNKPLASRQHGVGPTAVNEPKGKQNGKNIISGETLTLETLFGSSFMEELQSVEAPVSIQRGSTGPDNNIFISSIDENLLSGADPRNHQMSKFMLPHNSIDSVNFSSSAPVDIMAQVRPLYNHLDSNLAPMSPQMKFLHQEPMVNRDYRTNQRFPSNMIQRPFHNPNGGIAGFDVRSRRPMLNQMQSSNHAPHMMPDFPRGGPVSYNGNQAIGFLREVNQMQDFPFEARQANIGNRGFPIPATDINSGGPPEASQRLMEMELRANSDHIRPFPPRVHSQGIYGHEVDMSLRYR